MICGSCGYLTSQRGGTVSGNWVPFSFQLSRRGNMKRFGIAAILITALWLAAPTLAGEIIFEPNIEYANPDNQHLQLDMARPKEAAGELPAVGCIHGGGFRAGNRTRWDALCKELAGRGYGGVTI